MPYTIKTQQIAVKDPDTGEYSGIDVLTEQTTEGLLNELTAKGTAIKGELDAYANALISNITWDSTSGSAWTQAFGDFIVKGNDNVKRRLVFNSDNTVTWQTVT